MRLSIPFIASLAFTTFVKADMKALVYRGPAACDGCPEAVAALLKTSPSKFSVTFAGPNEDVDITPESLSKVDVYTQAGGGGMAFTGRIKPLKATYLR